MRVLGVLFVGLCLVMNASAELFSRDGFSQRDYGISQGAIDGLSGGEGWADSWAANGNVQFVPSQNLSFSAAGYTNDTGTTGSFATFAVVNVNATRTWSSSAVTSGVVWVSWLSSRPSVNSTSDRMGLTFTDGTTSVFIGERADDFGLGINPGYLNADQVDNVYTANDVHLIIAKMDLSTGLVEAWLDSSDVSSEGALGTADSSYNYSISSLDGTVQVRFGENSALRVSVDSLRIGSTLADVLAAPPAPPTGVLYEGFGYGDVTNFLNNTVNQDAAGGTGFEASGWRSFNSSGEDGLLRVTGINSITTPSGYDVNTTNGFMSLIRSSTGVGGWALRDIEMDIPMNADETYWMAVSIRNQDNSSSSSDYAALKYREGGSSLISVGFDNDEKLQVTLGSDSHLGTDSTLFAKGENVTIIAKLVLSSSGDDLLYVNAYQNTDSISGEPSVWDLTATNELGSGIIDNLGFTMGDGNTKVDFDEIRIGSSFGEVVSGIVAPYDVWAAQYSLSGTNALAGADPDGDMVDNLAEFALGGSPVDAGDAGYTLTAMVEEGGTNWLEYVHAQRKDVEAGLTYWLEISASLTTPAWTNAGYTVLTPYGDLDDDFYSVTNRVQIDDPEKFIRLQVEQTE